MAFSTRIFRNLDLGIEWDLRCKTMELESLRCIVNCLERVVVVRLPCASFYLETQSPKGHLNICTSFALFNGREKVIGNNQVGGFKYLVVNDKSYFFGRIGRENIFMDKVFKYMFIYLIIILKFVFEEKFY